MLRLPVPSVVVPSTNVTVPVGDNDVPEAATTAVKVTEEPLLMVGADEVNVTLDVIGLIVVRAADEEVLVS